MTKVLISSLLFISFLSGCNDQTKLSVADSPTVTEVALNAVNVYKKAKGHVFLVETMVDLNWYELGSAFAISYNNKIYILTAKHVVANSEMVYRLKDTSGKYYSVTKRILHKDQDIAILEIDGKLAKGLAIAKSNLEVGSDCYAIGAPLGFESYITDGIISKYFPDGTLTSTAKISPGSSGGPLLDKDGRVIGIAVSIIPSQAQFNFFLDTNNLNKSLIELLRTPS